MRRTLTNVRAALTRPLAATLVLALAFTLSSCATQRKSGVCYNELQNELQKKGCEKMNKCYEFTANTGPCEKEIYQYGSKTMFQGQGFQEVRMTSESQCVKRSWDPDPLDGDCLCGSSEYNVSTQFCYDGTIYDRCDGLSSYDVSTLICVEGLLFTK